MSDSYNLQRGTEANELRMKNKDWSKDAEVSSLACAQQFAIRAAITETSTRPTRAQRLRAADPIDSGMLALHRCQSTSPASRGTRMALTSKSS